MRKLARHLDNPIDSLILDVIDQLPLDSLYSMGLTPNMITTLGNVSRFTAAYFLFQGQKVTFFALYVLGYVFDCMDGHFARRYKMTSEWGDVYDHVSDIVTFIPYLYYIFFRSSLVGASMFYPILLLFVLMHGLMTFHLGCQQHYVTSNETLNMCKRLCRNPEWIRWSRFFGCGTYILFVGILGYMY